jgi:uncharacterized membrane protein YidH (DUF202 family)
MSKKKETALMGAVLLAVGAVLLIAGYNEYNSVGSSIGRAFKGSMSATTIGLFIGGGVCAILGLRKLLGK